MFDRVILGVDPGTRALGFAKLMGGRGLAASMCPQSLTDPAIAIPNLLYTYADLMDAGDFTGAAGMFRHGCLISQGQRIEGEG